MEEYLSDIDYDSDTDYNSDDTMNSSFSFLANIYLDLSHNDTYLSQQTTVNAEDTINSLNSSFFELDLSG